MNLKFWKKDDLALPDFKADLPRSELGLSTNTNLGLDLSSHFEPGAGQLGGLPPSQSNFGMPPQQSFQQTFPQQAQPLGAQSSFMSGQPFTNPVQPAHEEHQQSVSKDLEVIAAKLDTIRAQLEMLNTRIGNLEKAQQGSVPSTRRPWY